MPDRPVSLDRPAEWRHPLGLASGIEGRDAYPVVQVSYDDAAAYARWAGGSLPTVAEWERAARGRQDTPQPVIHWLLDDSGRPTANT